MNKPASPCNHFQNEFTGNVEPILNEVRHALARLIDAGEPTVIDLRAIPLAPGEEEAIESRLGNGEVRIRIDALGPSDIQETAYAGVWRVTHFNGEGEILGKFIEITDVPKIVLSPGDDLREAHEALSAALRTN
jgi:hydrogenase-1 operon protein HyaF